MTESKIANEHKLHFAVKHIKLNLVESLLNKGADICVQNDNGLSPLHIAFETKEKATWKTWQKFEDNNSIIDLILEANMKLRSNPVNKHGLSHFHIACSRDEPKVVDHFLTFGALINQPVNSQRHLYKRFTPLHFAAKFRCIKTLELLLKNGADVKQTDFEKKTALHIAAMEPCSDGVRLLLQYGADINSIDSHGNSPVHLAFKKQNYAIIDLLLSGENASHSNPTNAEGLSHFHIACSRNNVSLVKSFLGNAASVSTSTLIQADKVKYSETSDWNGFSPLHFAVSHNRAKIVELLLHSGANVDAESSEGYTPLHVACQYTYEIFREFIRNILCDLHKRGKITLSQFKPITDVNNVCEKNFGGMFGSIKKIDWSPNRKDHLKIIKLLVTYNSDVNYKDYNGSTPVYYAYCFAALGLSQLENNLDCSEALSTHIIKSLFKELYGRRKLILSNLLKLNVNFDNCCKEGSILQWLSLEHEWNDYETMELFLNAGANVNTTENYRWTPLHEATFMKCNVAVRVLLDYGANVDCRDIDDNLTPLHLAARNLDFDIIKILIDRGANVNARKFDGSTALHVAIVSYSCKVPRALNISLISALISAGADINSRDSNGFTPLHKTCECSIQAEELFSNLLTLGADINVKDNEGRSVCCYLYERAYGNSGFERLLKSCDIMLNHIVKMRVIGLLISKNSLSFYDQIKARKEVCEAKENIVVQKYKGEVFILQDTKINDYCTLHNAILKNENSLSRLAKNSRLQSIVQSESFDETYPNYGYLIRLKYQAGLDRADLLPTAKCALNSLAGQQLPDVCSEHICNYFTNVELKESIETLSSFLDCNVENSDDNMQLRARRTNKRQKVN